MKARTRIQSAIERYDNVRSNLSLSLSGTGIKVLDVTTELGAFQNPVFLVDASSAMKGMGIRLMRMALKHIMQDAIPLKDSFNIITYGSKKENFSQSTTASSDDTASPTPSGANVMAKGGASNLSAVLAFLEKFTVSGSSELWLNPNL